jgi:hypothetical protein
MVLELPFKAHPVSAAADALAALERGAKCIKAMFIYQA